MAIAGHNGIVSIATGASATYTNIDGIGDITVTDGRDTLDITDFVGSDTRQRITGLRDVSISLGGDVEIADNGFLALRASYVAGTTCYVRYLADGTNGMMVPVLVESFERKATADGKLELSVSLKTDGSFAPVVVGSGI